MGRTEIVVGTPAWHETRRVSFTGTDWASLFCPARVRPKWLPTPLQVWERMSGRTPPVVETDAYLEWGLRLEPAAELWFEDATGRRVTREDRLYARGERLVADPDGWETCVEGMPPASAPRPDVWPWAWEAKAPGPYGGTHWDAPGGGQQVPLVYQIQAQGRMYVTEAQGTSICALSWPRLLWGDVPRDERFLKVAAEKVEHFLDYHVQGDRPPVPSGDQRDAEILARLHNPEVRVVVMSGEIAELCTDIGALEAQIDELDARLQAKRNALRLWMREQKCERAVNPERTVAFQFKKGTLRRVNP